MDPREHRHVASVDGDRIAYVCGCVNAIHGPTGALRSVAKCPGHTAAQREVESLGAAYYEELGAIAYGIPQCALLLGQLREAVGPFPVAKPGAKALEVGCGCSMYAPGLLRAGYDYRGLEPSEWAAKWTANTFDVPVQVGTLETFRPGGKFDLILAAHCLEHMIDAPSAILRLVSLLADGGELWVIIPDDIDPLNPDHLWFFNLTSLRGVLESAGLKVEAIASYRRVPHENFMYARASF